MALTSTVLTVTAASIFTSSGNSVVTAMYLCNTSEIVAQFCIYAVPSGGSANLTNAIYYQVPLTPYDTYVIDSEKLMLEDGDTLYANVFSITGTISSELMPAVAVTVSSIGI